MDIIIIIVPPTDGECQGNWKSLQNYWKRGIIKTSLMLISSRASDFTNHSLELKIGYDTIRAVNREPEEVIIMEELLVYAIFLYEELATQNDYNKRLDELFLDNPEDEDLLYLECETDIKKAVIYISTHVDYNHIDYERFGRILMSKLKVVYENYSDIKEFASKMFSLWESLPGNIQKAEPFLTLSYADDPLSWGDEEQTRNIYEHMINYYKD